MLTEKAFHRSYSVSGDNIGKGHKKQLEFPKLEKFKLDMKHKETRLLVCWLNLFGRNRWVTTHKKRKFYKNW